MTKKEKTFGEWEKFTNKEKKLILIAVEKYHFFYQSGLEMWIEPDVFIKSGEWKRILLDNRMGIA